MKTVGWRSGPTSIDAADIKSVAKPTKITGNVLFTTDALAITNGAGFRKGAAITFNTRLSLESSYSEQQLNMSAGSSDVTFTEAVAANTSDLTLATSRIAPVTVEICTISGIDVTTLGGNIESSGSVLTHALSNPRSTVLELAPLHR